MVGRMLGWRRVGIRRDAGEVWREDIGGRVVI